ncbi:MAG TPA: PDZ domain-containing protein [Puia sp.]|jgi:serine protease Do|nr:PDZ domain-containing protein [Puia sp.]
MKQYVLKLSGATAIALLLSSSLFAQDQDDVREKVLTDKIKTDKLNEGDEIIIRRKGDKDIKVTVEIKDNKVFVDGKPVTEFKNDDVIVRKMQMPFITSDDNMTFIAPRSPFRSGGWSYRGDNDVVVNMNNAKTAFLGVNWEDVDNGAKITEVTKESAAEKAGLKKGDIITKIGDTKIEEGELSETIHKYKPEDKVTITYMRDGKEQKTTATLGKTKEMKFKSFNVNTMPKMSYDYNFNNDGNYSFSYGKPRLGIKAQDLEEGKGAKVLDVDDESPAEKAGIKEGDVINEFDGKPVENADDLSKLARENKEKYSYKIKLTRDGKSQEVEVKIPRKLKTADL